MKILGIDPGSHTTGYGVIEKRKNDLVYLQYGEIKTDQRHSLANGLVMIYDRLMAVIGETKPDCMAVEDIFYGKNVKSLIKQGHVRGVTLLAGAHGGITISEYSPLEIKKAVVGYGRAEKSQVQRMVQAILNIEDLPPLDASDALAVAICHAHMLRG